MKILVLYKGYRDRKTIDDHLYSFKRYVPEAEFYYCNILLKVPSYLRLIKWDGIILHYTLLAERFSEVTWKYLRDNLYDIGKLSGVKVALPQDEYCRFKELWKIFKEGKVDAVFTCAMPIDYDKLYPLSETSLKDRFTTFTGFVDEDTLAKIERLSQEDIKRDVDIGYRARSLPYWLGRHGQIKGDVAKAVLNASNQHRLKLDISTDPKDVFFGDDWIRFLLRCRTTLGCLGGASLLDPDDEFRNKVEKYVHENPQASFEEVEEKCFPGKDFSLNLFALSPRHFECAMTRTCQVLVEGDYQGIFEPGKHYIELKQDFSNLDDVLAKVVDKEYCQKIADATYDHVVASEKFTYRVFANQIIDYIAKNASAKRRESAWRSALVKGLLTAHENGYRVRYLFYRLWRKNEYVVKPAIKSFWKGVMSKLSKCNVKAT